MPWTNTTVTVVNRNDQVADVNSTWEDPPGTPIFTYGERMRPNIANINAFKINAEVARDNYIFIRDAELAKAIQVEDILNS